MDKTWLQCDWLKIGRLSIPPFRLGNAEVVCLSWPLPSGSREEKELVDALTGKRKCPFVEVSGRISRAGRPKFTKLPINGDLFRYEMTYQGNTSYVTQERGTAILKKFGFDSHVPLTALSGDHRELLGIELAWNDADVVIFDTFGKDSTYDLVTQKINHGAAIQISYPLVDRLTSSQDCHPNAKRLEVSGWENYVTHERLSRQQVISQIISLIKGRYSRQETAKWAEAWLSLSDLPITDRLTWQALNALAGATLIKNGQCYHAIEDYQKWLERLQ